MEKLARRMARNISNYLNYSEEQYEVIAYGMIALVQLCIFVISVALIGGVIGAFEEALLVCITVALLRKYSGGSHAKTIEGCTVLGVIVCVIVGRISVGINHLSIDTVIILSSAIYIVALILIIYLAPVDSIQKPIKSREKRRRMKKYSLYIVFSACAISCVFLFLDNVSWALSITFGILWQVLTLVPSVLVKVQERGERDEKIK